GGVDAMRPASARWMIFLWAAPIVAQSAAAPAPLLQTGTSVDWWFVFKFNTATASSCVGGVPRACVFGGQLQPYKFGLQFAVASSAAPALKAGGGGCLGDTTADPVGATFNQVYNGKFFYVIWNDQFYTDPMATQGAPWGHSKGMLAWNSDGNGFVM